MSIWTKFRDIAEMPFKSSEDLLAAGFHAVTGAPTAAEKRSQANMVNEQIKAYKDQTALSQQQLDETRAQKDVVRRQINEKQIRSLRNSSGTNRGGFLNQGTTNASNPPSTLGASNQLTSKLGS